MKTTQFKKNIQLLTYHYFGVITALFALFVLIVFRVIELGVPQDMVSAAMERYAIAFTIIAIPLALKLFAYMTKKKAFGSEKKALGVYTKAFYIRLYILCAVTALNELLFAVSRNMNFFWLTVIVFIAFAFCKPSFLEFSELVSTPDTDK